MENKQQQYSTQFVLTIIYFGVQKGPGKFFMGSWKSWKSPRFFASKRVGTLVYSHCCSAGSHCYVVVYAIPSSLCIASFIKAATLNPGSLFPRQQPQGIGFCIMYSMCSNSFIHRCCTSLESTTCRVPTLATLRHTRLLNIGDFTF